MLCLYNRSLEKRRSANIRAKFAQEARDRRGQRHGAARGLRVRGVHRDVRRDLPGARGGHRARHAIAASPATTPRRSASSPPPSSRACRSSSAPIRSRRPPRSCTSSPRSSTTTSRTFQAEDEIAGICSAIGAAYGGSLGLTTTSGPGMALKTEAIGLARHAGAAAGDRQRAARRSIHRSADQDRAVRPAAGDLRPARRMPGPGDRGAIACRLLRLRASRPSASRSST